MKDFKYSIIEQHLEEMKLEDDVDLRDYILEYEEVLNKTKAWDKVAFEFEKIRLHGGALPIKNDQEFGLKVIDIIMDYESEESE